MDGKRTTMEFTQIDVSGAHDAVATLWLTKADVCKQLCVSPRTVDRLVKRGEVVRRKLGRESRFRIVGDVEPRDLPTFARQTARYGSPAPPALGGAGQMLIGQQTEIESLEIAQGYITQLVGLVDRLVERVATLERQNGRRLRRRKRTVARAA